MISTGKNVLAGNSWGIFGRLYVSAICSIIYSWWRVIDCRRWCAAPKNSPPKECSKTSSKLCPPNTRKWWRWRRKSTGELETWTTRHGCDCWTVQYVPLIVIYRSITAVCLFGYKPKEMFISRQHSMNLESWSHYCVDDRFWQLDWKMIWFDGSLVVCLLFHWRPYGCRVPIFGVFIHRLVEKDSRNGTWGIPFRFAMCIMCVIYITKKKIIIFFNSFVFTAGLSHGLRV